jgi:hypothetical protein
MYSIPSKGIHELKENECSAYFPALLAGVEFISEEKLEA